MRTYNAIDMKGRLYSHNLEVKDFDKGEAITGTVTLEVDDKGTLVDISVFARPTFNSGKRNSTYDALESMMNGEYQTVAESGDAADWLSMTGNIDVSYYPAKNGGGDEEFGLSRGQRIRGGFINPNKKHEYRNRWTMDLMITQVTEVEADTEKNLPRMARVNGYFVDAYNKRLMEVSFQARKPQAIDVLLGLPVSFEQPYFTSIWGEQQIVKRVVVKKSMFGDDEVKEFDNKSWVITGMATEPYEFGDKAAITVEEFNEYKQALHDHKADKAKDAEEDGDGDNGLAF